MGDPAALHPPKSTIPYPDPQSLTHEHLHNERKGDVHHQPSFLPTLPGPHWYPHVPLAHSVCRHRLGEADVGRGQRELCVPCSGERWVCAGRAVYPVWQRVCLLTRRRAEPGAGALRHPWLGDVWQGGVQEINPSLCCRLALCAVR